MALGDAIELLGGALRIAARVLALLVDFFIDGLFQMTGRLLHRIYDRKGEPSDDLCVVIGIAFWAAIALVLGIYLSVG